ncbi:MULTISPECIES: diguanylate cyclase domain-containing protein [Polaromonas]|uniref:Diguanylate cyclase domain-containing protein n=1 Tax=Polaromonas aquatica TaxID=332657 RepID=A0ABW1TU42_9BURK
MEKLAIGLWGCFFGTTALILAGAGLAFVRSLHRISLNAALTGLASAFFVLAFLGALPISNADALARFLAHLATTVSGMLAYQLLALLGILRSRAKQQRAMWGLGAWCACIMMAGWWLPPLQSLTLSIGMACLLGLAGLGVCLRSALRGVRLAWTAVLCVFCMLVALDGLGWIALNRQQALWSLHAVSAVAATLYLATLAYVLWARYAYLIELHEVMAHGPGYDPVTRMRSHAETGQMVGAIFKSFRNKPEEPLGVMVLTIANLYALNKLHGAVAVNSALFVCAGRLRRSVPAHVDMGRLGHDGFLLIMRNCRESGRLINVARSVEARLRKSVSLGTSRDVARFESDNTVWVAEIGVGVMIVSNPAMRGSSAIAMARGMSRTAMSYASRLAWFDHSSGEIVELPVLASA